MYLFVYLLKGMIKEMNMANVTQKVVEKIPVLGKIKIPAPKKKKTVVIIGAFVVLLIAAIVIISMMAGGKEDKKILSATVTRGNVTKVIEGSGTIEAIDQYEITALVTGEILSDHFEEGQEVKEGDLLYEIDTADVENSIEKSRASLEKAQLSYEQSLETVTNLTVRSTITGTVQEVYIENGDSVSNNGKVISVINSDYMRLKINFNKNDAVNLSAGQSAQVYLDFSSEPIVGEVESVATGSLINESGAPVTAVEIVVANPGAIKPGDSATAIVGNYACNSAGTFEYYDSAVVSAKSSGEAYNLRVKVGDKITAGDAIVYLDNSSARVSSRQSELSLKDSQLALDNLIEERNDYNITAPISGKVIQKNSKAGDKLGSGDKSNTMAIIADLSSLIFQISVDELDISNIKVGQTVTVTADALEKKTFTGHVENVSIVGTSSNGVTSYPVKVVMDDGIDSGLIPGMNVNASIVIDSRQDVLRVPVSAINRGNIVYVKSDSETAKNSGKATNAPAEENAEPKTEENSQESAVRGNRTRPSEQTGADGGNTQWGQRATGENGARPNLENRQSQWGNREKPNAADGTAPSEVKPSETTQKTETEDKSQNETKKEAPAGNGAKANGESPRAAINERLLKTMQENAPDGYTAVIVEIGLSDGNFTEIISGLSEGDEVYLPDKTSSSNAAAGFGGMGGMNRGMGGMVPSGMGGAMTGGRR